MGFKIGCVLRVVVTLLSTHDVMLGGTPHQPVAMMWVSILGC